LWLNFSHLNREATATQQLHVITQVKIRVMRTDEKAMKAVKMIHIACVTPKTVVECRFSTVVVIQDVILFLQLL